jgi:hypothetical protein
MNISYIFIPHVRVTSHGHNLIRTATLPTAHQRPNLKLQTRKMPFIRENDRLTITFIGETFPSRHFHIRDRAQRTQVAAFVKQISKI